MNVIELSLRSQKFLDKLDSNIRKRIEGRLKKSENKSHSK